MKKIKIKILNQLKDNYSYILGSKNSSYVSIIDPAESKSHLDYLKNNNLSLENIFLTHHHDDHVAGVSDLLSIFPNTKVYSPSKLIKSTTFPFKSRSKRFPKAPPRIRLNDRLLTFDSRPSTLDSRL